MVAPQNPRLTLVVILGGICSTFHQKMWQPLLEDKAFDCHFLVSAWEDFSVHPDIYTLPNLILEVESYAQKEAVFQKEAKKYDIKPLESKPQNTLSMWYKWGRLSQLLSGFPSDAIVLKMRSDLEFTAQELQRLIEAIKTLGSTYDLVIPKGSDFYGGIHDIVAFGYLPQMKTYLSILSTLDACYQRYQFFHPEWILRYHLINRHGLKINRILFRIALRNKLYDDKFEHHHEGPAYLFWHIKRDIFVATLKKKFRKLLPGY